MKLIVIKKNYKFLIGSSKQRVLEVLFRYPDKEFSLSELAKLSRIAKANIGMILNELQKSGFLEITRLSNLWRVKANQKSWNFIRAKIVYNLNFVYQSGLVEFLVDYFKNPKSIVLFGSFRKGEDISGSDMDIAIENDSHKDNEIIGLRELSEFEKIIERKIQIHLFNREKININVFNNIANGIVLSGFLEVKK